MLRAASVAVRRVPVDTRANRAAATGPLVVGLCCPTPCGWEVMLVLPSGLSLLFDVVLPSAGRL